MNYITDYFFRNITANYQCINMNNQYNFIISILNMPEIDDNCKKYIIEHLKINCGLTFFNSFRDYCIRKLGIKNNLILFLE